MVQSDEVNKWVLDQWIEEESQEDVWTCRPEWTIAISGKSELSVRWPWQHIYFLPRTQYNDHISTPLLQGCFVIIQRIWGIFHPAIEDEVKIEGKIVSLEICMIFPPSKSKCLQNLFKMQKGSQPHLVVRRWFTASAAQTCSSEALEYCGFGVLLVS